MQEKSEAVYKMRLFKSVVLPTLLYGSETWVPSSSDLKRMQGFVMWCLLVILGGDKMGQNVKHRATVNGWD